ncbi:MAG TPA: GMC family oxidoreductase [Bryobacteraceae bacterium]|jgi:choline dehydrogenase-like flavoprotein
MEHRERISVEGLFQIRQSSMVHDVVVVGSGAGGGTVAKVLTDLGIRVTMLEAGPMLDPAKDFKMFAWPYSLDHRGLGPGCELYFRKGISRPLNYFSAPNGAWEIKGEPYTVAEGSKFTWFRSRILGGRTNHYGRISLRFADYDFKSYSRDGLGTDWPITYDELAPYYDKVEDFIGVFGSREGLRGAPDGKFLPPPPPRAHELLMKRACQKLNIPCIPARLAILTRNHNGRPKCHYCAQCGRGCTAGANYSSSQVQIFPAMKTGRLRVINNAMAREILTDGAGKVSGLSYIDKTTRTEKQIRCRVLILAASACESARLLLNSKGAGYANGLANGSGQVGRNLTDSIGFTVSGHIPALEGMPIYNSDGVGGMHVYVPWWLPEKSGIDFPRGYHIELGGGFHMPAAGAFRGVCQSHEGYGTDLKRAIRSRYGTEVSFAGRGEMIPNNRTFCEIDPSVVDQWGIPVLRFHWQYSDNEVRQAQHMHDTFGSIIEAMGGTAAAKMTPSQAAEKIAVGGQHIHEVGTVRMGSSRETSVLNKYSQTHEVKNLFVADGGPFVSNPDKNPTLTICALAWRAAEYVAEEMRKGNV